MTVTRRKYDEAQAERRAANEEITKLWLEHVKPAQERYERDPRVVRADRRRRVAESTIHAFEQAHPAEFPEAEDDDCDGW